jgi:hypothetical protein
MMRYCYRDRGQQQEDCWAVLRMRDSSACVIMLDPLYRYGKGQFVFYIGGYCRSSAVRLQIPTEEHWCLVIDQGGCRSRVRAELEVLTADELRTAPKTK